MWITIFFTPWICVASHVHLIHYYFGFCKFLSSSHFILPARILCIASEMATVIIANKICRWQKLIGYTVVPLVSDCLVWVEVVSQKGDQVPWHSGTLLGFYDQCELLQLCNITKNNYLMIFSTIYYGLHLCMGALLACYMSCPPNSN